MVFRYSGSLQELDESSKGPHTVDIIPFGEGHAGPESQFVPHPHPMLRVEDRYVRMGRVRPSIELDVALGL